MQLHIRCTATRKACRICAHLSWRKFKTRSTRTGVSLVLCRKRSSSVHRKTWTWTDSWSVTSCFRSLLCTSMKQNKHDFFLLSCRTTCLNSSASCCLASTSTCFSHLTDWNYFLCIAGSCCVSSVSSARRRHCACGRRAGRTTRPTTSTSSSVSQSSPSTVRFLQSYF